MNDTLRMTRTPREIVDFVARVRGHLADLDPAEVEELTEGLEADLVDQVADSGPGVLRDPASYAAELRAAAGLPGSGPAGTPLGRRLARSAQRWSVLREGAKTSPGVQAAVELLVAMRPAWWVLRGYLAVQLLDIVLGPWEFVSLIPKMGSNVATLAVLGVAIVASVQVGRGVWWPGSRAVTSRSARWLLVAANVVAVVAGAAVVTRDLDDYSLHAVAATGNAWGETPRETRAEMSGVMLDGRRVKNLFAYDASGRPLVGVQLYDQAGRPVAIDPESSGRLRLPGVGPVQAYPWLNGAEQRWNVYPLPVRRQRSWTLARDPWSTSRPPFLPTPPAAVVPPGSCLGSCPAASVRRPAGPELCIHSGSAVQNLSFAAGRRSMNCHSQRVGD